jgi:hypothetical protein
MLGERGADLFDAPDRSALVKLTLFADECRSGAFENPDVAVRGLFANHGGDHSGQAAELYVEDVVNGFTRSASYDEGELADRLY